MNGPSISQEDVTRLFTLGFTDEIVLDTVLIAAWARFQFTLSAGVGASPDFEPLALPTVPPLDANPIATSGGPYVRIPEIEFAPFAFFQERFGFIPNVYRAQSLRPDVIEAEAEAIRVVLLTDNHLTRLQKERIFLEVSAANCNAYFVAVQAEILGSLGAHSDLSEADAALLEFARKLVTDPSRCGVQALELLHRNGFSDEQVLEAVVMTSLTIFLNTVQLGVGAKPDFALRTEFSAIPSKIANLLAAKARLTEGSLAFDPDAETVLAVQKGDLSAFEDLMNRHSRRVYRSLIGILGSADEARDAMQDTFLKAFQHIGDFKGRSKFSTWLRSISINVGIQLLRDRKRLQSLDADAADVDDGIPPRQIRAWTDDPEELFSKEEVRTLVESHVMRLPAKYRVVLMLRDIEQLSIEESAAVLGLSVPALKARHLRGRMMLREALTPHFVERTNKGVA
jgi:RNA polymerase sigma-70 factor (ECF subfamily)